MDEEKGEFEPSRRKKPWLLYVALGALFVLLVWVGVLAWKILLLHKEGDTQGEMLTHSQALLPQQQKMLPESLPKQRTLAPISDVSVTLDTPHEPVEKVEVKRQTKVSPQGVVPERLSGVALIVDDMGNDIGALKRLLSLSIPLAISILPNTPYAVKVAKLTHQAGHMVMLHLPMEPVGEYYRNRMDTSFLRVGMDEVTVRTKILEDLQKVPYVQGINNHMGSRLTSMVEPMTWVMQLCREKALFFVDSKTTSKSLAETVAKQYGLVWGARAIFLDDSLEPLAMQKAWQAMERCVQRKKHCIVIAHPHRQTLAFLESKQAVLQAWPVHPLRALLHAPKPRHE